MINGYNHTYFIDVKTNRGQIEEVPIGNILFDPIKNEITCSTNVMPEYFRFYNPKVTNYLQMLVFANVAIGHYQYSLQNKQKPEISKEKFLQMFALSDYPLQSLINFQT